MPTCHCRAHRPRPKPHHCPRAQLQPAQRAAHARSLGRAAHREFSAPLAPLFEVRQLEHCPNPAHPPRAPSSTGGGGRNSEYPIVPAPHRGPPLRDRRRPPSCEGGPHHAGPGSRIACTPACPGAHGGAGATGVRETRKERALPSCPAMASARWEHVDGSKGLGAAWPVTTPGFQRLCEGRCAEATTPAPRLQQCRPRGQPGVVACRDAVTAYTTAAATNPPGLDRTR